MGDRGEVCVTIYVDKAKRYGNRWWCHLLPDHATLDIDELDDFAMGLGMKPEWKQALHTTPPYSLYMTHYDLVPTKRALAIKRGAVEIGSIEWMRLARETALKMMPAEQIELPIS
jgi:hypothetical protein